MDLYESLARQAEAVHVSPSETSFFSERQTMLDPRLFRNEALIPSVRGAVMSMLFGHLNQHYVSAESWSIVWLAGSGVSYMWAAHRSPADLDCLIGVDFTAFRQSNQSYKGFSDQEIATMINEGMYAELLPLTGNFLGEYELTYYVNANSYDIRNIRPYAAYNLTTDSWTVAPDTYGSMETPKDWEAKAERDATMTYQIVDRYTEALEALQAATSPAARVNATTAFNNAVSQGASLYADIHHSRGAAFSQSGEGYDDYANYRWQYGKSKGVVQALRRLHETAAENKKKSEEALYGQELPSPATLIRRAASYYKS